MAGIGRGRKQRNSTIGLSEGSRNRTQTMVGSNSTSIAIEVMAASSSEATIASMRSGVLTMLVHATRVRGLSTLVPRVENSNIAAIGARTNAPSTRKTAPRNSCSLTRRDRVMRSTQPARGASLEERVEQHHDCNDDDHRQRESLGQARLCAAGLAGGEGGEHQGQDDASLRDQGRHCRVRGEGVREKKKRASEEGGSTQRG